MTEKSIRYDMMSFSATRGTIISYSFMPLAHSERISQTIVFINGGR